ncbi:MAG: HAMP domain-containing histidine kinase [Ruminococcaceae bacterium]|nr:HAMP domain-containing histidine kinase [Oscillospiraceae bacterium]
MNRFKTLRNKATLLVIAIMAVSALLTGAALIFLIHIGAIPTAFRARVSLIPITVCVGSLIGAVLAAFAMRYFIKPLDELVAATKKIAEGDFSVRVTERKSLGEIATLVRNFNSMAQELEGTEMFRSDFVNNFSHEFKTPIVSIRGFAKQLKSDALSEDERRKYAEIIADECERLSNMSTNVLLLSKLQNLELITDKSAYSLDEQIRRSVLLFAKDWEAKNIDLDIDLEEIDYTGNEEIMSHVWVNLIGNAVKYTPEGGRISVRAIKKADEIIVRVSDNGIGMSRAVMERIFDKFYQGDGSHTGSGNGLGLPLVKRIIELCGGRLTVESELGAGSEFSVYIPL